MLPIVLAVTAGLAAQSSRPTSMVVVPFEAGRFKPTDPSRPEGTQIAVLWGEPDRGPSTMLMQMKKGNGRLHVHTADYQLVILEGTMTHWGAGDQESGAKPLGPGSYWFQPGGEPHGDSCLTNECLMFISWAGARDGRLADLRD